MRIPKVHQYHIEKSKDKKVKYDYDLVEVELKPSEYVDDMSAFENEKELHRFVVRLKYYIRNSYEYKSLMKFLKRYRGMYCCGIHPNLTTWKKIPIEIHHTPLVIEDILYIIINKRVKLGESLKMSAIAREVMELHYLQLVGLYPLDVTCHEYAHGDNNDLFIPLDAVFGDPDVFMKVYSDFVSDAMKQKYDNIKQLNTGYNMVLDEVPEALVRKYVYVVQKGQEVVSTKKLREFINEYNK